MAGHEVGVAEAKVVNRKLPPVGTPNCWLPINITSMLEGTTEGSRGRDNIVRLPQAPGCHVSVVASLVIRERCATPCHYQTHFPQADLTLVWTYTHGAMEDKMLDMFYLDKGRYKKRQ